MHRAIVTGAAGQDGSYLAELLLEKGYRVLGIIRKGEDTSNLRGILGLIELEESGDVRKEEAARRIRTFSPHEVYNFAGVSFIPDSWHDPDRTFEINTLLVTAFLEGLRIHAPSARYYQASSSEIFGDPPRSPQDEKTPFHPSNPYGVSKLAAHLLTGLYRRRYGMFAASGILYNHESPRRPVHYVTQKIARAAAEISMGRTEKLRLGNLDARRDWGFAGDFVRGIWLMLQHETAGDYVLATGETHSIKDFLRIAFSHVGLDWTQWVETDPALVRPIDVGKLVGDPSLAKRVFGWKPEVPFDQLVTMMVDAQVRKLQGSGA
ncbi:MAG: gmd [Deltaproteobacteria bacterium]|nr:gmd [Deltaproteobacteria bacterium]